MTTANDSFTFKYQQIYPASACCSDGSWRDVWFRVEHDTYNPSQLSFSLLSESVSEQQRSTKYWLDPLSRQCHLVVRAPIQCPVTIRGIYGIRSNHHEVKLFALGYDIGCSEDPLSLGGRVHITVELTRGRILLGMDMLTRSYDGTITREDKREVIEWEEQGDKITAYFRYVYEEISIARNKAQIQIERPCFWIEHQATDNESIKDIVDNTERQVDDIILILSLCSREQINWYEIAIDVPEARDKYGIYPCAKRRREMDVPDHPEFLDPLVDHRDLINGGMKQLVSALKASKHRDAIGRAISYEVASRRNRGLESRYILCHAALEAIVHDLVEQDSSLPRFGEDWDAFSREIDNLSKSFITGNGLDKRLTEYVRKKRGELKRIPLVDAILHEVEVLNVRKDDLWPLTVGFEKGLREAIDLRNALVHHAIVGEVDPFLDNIARLQILIERIILRVLDWPNDKIWKWHDQELKWMNRGPDH